MKSLRLSVEYPSDLMPQISQTPHIAAQPLGMYRTNCGCKCEIECHLNIWLLISFMRTFTFTAFIHFNGSGTCSCTVSIERCLFTTGLMKIWVIIMMDFKTFEYFSISAQKLLGTEASCTSWTNHGSWKTGCSKVYCNNCANCWSISLIANYGLVRHIEKSHSVLLACKNKYPRLTGRVLGFTRRCPFPIPFWTKVYILVV